jgi:site-specific recombinase XerD
MGKRRQTRLARRPTTGALAQDGTGFLARALAGQLSPHTQRAYASDIAAFLTWLTGEARSVAEWQGAPDSLELLRRVDRAAMLNYRTDLASGYSPLTVNRKLATIRSLFAEAVAQGVLPTSPAAGIKGLRVNGEYQATPALSRSQARALVAAPDVATLRGLRDRALLHLALRTGLRCAELAALTVADLGEEQGHKVARVIGKGGKVRRAKLAGEVWRDLTAWLDESGRAGRGDAPVFVALRKVGRGDGGRWIACEVRLSTVAVSDLVKRHLRGIVPDDQAQRVGPHSLRATFITLALKGGAALHKVQQAAGHADPRTTMRYARLGDDLDDNAADYVRLTGRD